MATTAEWVEGARPRTLPNALAPVLAGTGAALAAGPVAWGGAGLALVVALALIVGVNYANDYSDGVRGADAARVGPVRLVGSGAAEPGRVRAAAFGCFGVAAVAGLVLAATTTWWLVPIGLGCLVAAWTYTGGRRPYGYAGLGEVAVFVFFGLVATLGTQYVAAGRLTVDGLACAVAVGAFSCAVLVANNLRDIPSDAAVGKRTLAVRLGDRATRRLYAVLLLAPYAATAVLAVRHPAALVALVTAVPAGRAARTVLRGATGRGLVPVLRDTGLTLLAWAAGTAVALAAT